jgi:transcriptional regulator with XRE-family HTH domain
MTVLAHELRQRLFTPSYQQRLNFRERLHQALKAAGYRPNEHSLLTRHFNAAHAGPPVAVSSVFRWLNGETIPTPDKLETLARLLNVSPAWLRYGS